MTSVARRQEHDDSGEYSDASQDVEHNNSGNDGGQHVSDYDSQGSDSEQSGNDPEETNEKRVDDDEDRSNPQYIPKRGTFYEHDDRTAASGEESTNNTTSETPAEGVKKEGSEAGGERRRAPRKSEVVNKWSHDKYNENEQVPKSRDELVSIYGYDIRNEDAPPHARRNRRYGRGPNKYTRTWEDEEAYRRAAAAPRHAPAPEDFPELGARPGRKERRPQRPRSKSQPASNESLENGSNNLRRNASVKTKGKIAPKVVPTRTVTNKSSKPATTNNKDTKMPPIENLTITATVVNSSPATQPPQRKVNATVAQQRPVPTEISRKKPTTQTTQPQAPPPPANKSPPAQNQQTNKQTTQTNAQTQNATAETRGSKRYSSLRQRPLAETYSPQQAQAQQAQAQQAQAQQAQQAQAAQAQQQHRYHAEYQQNQQPAPHQGSPGPQIHPQQMMHQQQQMRLIEQTQLVQHPHHAMHNIPQPHNMAQMQPAQGYAPPAIMPTQYMQVNQVQQVPGQSYGGALYPAQYPQHIYQPHHNYSNIPQASQSGVTYYKQENRVRRANAAIPIVRPAAHTPANSSEKDNIDRIVENMFVRKPWPATSDAKDKPQEARNSQEPATKEPSISTDVKTEASENDVTPDTNNTDKQTTEPENTNNEPEKTEENQKKPDETSSNEAESIQNA